MNTYTISGFNADNLAARRARALCAECPAIQACRKNLRETQRTQLVAGPNGGPEGTWAGILFRAKGMVA